MRTTTSSLLVAALLLALAAPAAAGESDAMEAERRLATLERLAEDPGTTWKARWKAYKQAKEAIDGLEGTEQDTAKDAYLAMRPMVAASLRRDELPLGGWIMGLVAALILWGGFTLHVRIAAKQSRKPAPED